MINLNELTNKELLNLVNNELKDSLSVNKVCQKYKIGKWTLTNRLNKLGFKYNKDLKQYTKIQDTNETIKNESQTVINKIPATTLNTNNKVILKEIESIKTRLEALESNNITTDSKIVIKNTKDTVVKSIRMYTEVKKELDKYIKKHKNIKVIDIINKAILEYITNNK